MSSKKDKKKAKPKKDANPLNETLNKVKSESKMLQAQLDQRRVLTAQARIGRVHAENAQLEAKRVLEAVKSDTKDVTAFMSLQYDLSVNKLNEVIKNLQEEINCLKKQFNNKAIELDEYKTSTDEELKEKDDEINRLKNTLSTQHIEYEVILLDMINKLTKNLDEDAKSWTDESEKLHNELKDSFIKSHLIPPKYC